MKLWKCGKTLDGMGQNWWDIASCRLDKKDRYFGFRKDYYNGDIYCFGFWFFHIGWMVITEYGK